MSDYLDLATFVRSESTDLYVWTDPNQTMIKDWFVGHPRNEFEDDGRAESNENVIFLGKISTVEQLQQLTQGAK